MPSIFMKLSSPVALANFASCMSLLRRLPTKRGIIHTQTSVAKFITDNIRAAPVVVFSKSSCPFCFKVKSTLQAEQIPFTCVDIDKLERPIEIQHALVEHTGMKTVPQVFIGGELIGGHSEMMQQFESGKLMEALKAVDLIPKSSKP